MLSLPPLTNPTTFIPSAKIVVRTQQGNLFGGGRDDFLVFPNTNQKRENDNSSQGCQQQGAGPPKYRV